MYLTLLSPGGKISLTTKLVDPDTINHLVDSIRINHLVDSIRNNHMFDSIRINHVFDSIRINHVVDGRWSPMTTIVKNGPSMEYFLC